jgi:ADP-heptose:LPS heptosyltransferase
MADYYFKTPAPGLGDVFFSHFVNAAHTYPKMSLSAQKIFQRIKILDPESKIEVLIFSGNDQIELFYQRCPDIDQLTILPYYPDHESEASKIVSGKKNVLDLFTDEWEDNPCPEFFMDKKEKKIAQSIMDNGPFVALHPFGGRPERDMRGNININEIIDTICQKFNCVLLGGNCVRTENYQNTIKLNQNIDYNRSNLFNLINVGTSRLHGYLSAKCKKFVGVASCYCVTAAAFNVPSLVFNSEKLKIWHDNPWDAIGYFLKTRNTNVQYFNKMTDDLHVVLNNFLNEK